jgi:hypothetical protein
MGRIQTMALRFLAVGALVLGTGALTGCAAEVEPAYYPDAAYYPPPAFVATAAPVYYEGRPVYWYGNRWYYRNGGGWGYYRREPAYLAGRRGYAGRGYVAPRPYAYRRR